MIKNILAIQMSSIIGDVEANFAKVETLINDFYLKTERLPDIIVLPEVWTVGWYTKIFEKFSDETNKTEDFLSKIAEKYSVNIIGGSYIRKNDGVLKNTCPVISREGKSIARYEKIHLYSPDGEKDAVSEGNAPVIVDIEGLKIGLSICYDIRFPELFRSYINSNYPPELLINMSAWPLTRTEQYTVMACARAIENQSYFLALSQTGLIKDGVYNAGNSVFVDSMGNIIKKLDKDEGCIFAEINTDTVYDTRRQYPNLKNRKIFDFGFIPEYKEGACLV